MKAFKALGLFVVVVTGLAPELARADPVLIAENGQGKLPIYVSQEASEVVQLAVGELEKYLEQISGADFETTPRT